CWANSFERPPGLPETPGCQLGLPALPISAICSQIGLSLTAEASMLMAALAPTAGEKLKAGLLRIRLPVMRDLVRWCWGWAFPRAVSCSFCIICFPFTAWGYGRLLEVSDWSYREIFNLGVHGPMGRTVRPFF